MFKWGFLFGLCCSLLWHAAIQALAALHEQRQLVRTVEHLSQQHMA